MRRRSSYINKYGHEYGLLLYVALQKEAAHARWKSDYRARIMERREKPGKARLVHNVYGD